MLGIDQTVVLTRSKDRGYDQQTVLSSFRKFIADPGELRRCCGIAPIRWELADLKLFSVQIVRNFRDSQDQVGGRVVLVEMDEILQHRKRLML